MNFEVKGCAVDIFLGVNEGKERKREGTRRQTRLTAGRIFQEQEIFLKNRRDNL